jgi:hypothetical protein
MANEGYVSIVAKVNMVLAQGRTGGAHEQFG